MTTFGFWNVHSLHDQENDFREFARLAAELALEPSLDALFLIECDIPPAALESAFADGPTYYSVPCGERFKVLVRFDPQFMPRLPLPVPSEPV